MKIPKYKFDSDIELMNLGDIHRGSKVHDTKLFQKAINYIKNHNNCFWYSTGDMLDVNIPSSKFFDTASAPLSVEQQALYYELDEIADKGLFIVGSNHHKRFERVTGLNLDEIIAKDLGIDYLGYSTVVNITCIRTSYFMVAHHGTGNGSTMGAKANRLEKFGSLYHGADIYTKGHTHTYTTFKSTMKYIDRKRNLISHIEANFVSTAHCLQWKGSYGEEKEYPETTPGFSIIRLRGSNNGNGTNKKVGIDLFN